MGYRRLTRPLLAPPLRLLALVRAAPGFGLFAFLLLALLPVFFTLFFAALPFADTLLAASLLPRLLGFPRGFLFRR